jgi:hypothetical protein
MNGEPKSGVSTISPGRLQCIRRDSAGPTDRRRRRRGGGGRSSLEIGVLSSGVSIDVLNAISYGSHACYMFRPANIPYLSHSNNSW